MSAIAEFLIRHGFSITGSDLQTSDVTDRLESLGAKIFKGHSQDNIGDAEVVVYSSAVKEGNPELDFARRKKIPVIRRAEMLAELMRMKFGIAIAGTHGKTTTTSMVGSVLAKGGLDPTVIVGGISPVFGSNARIGSSEFLVVEADEFDRSFLKLTPTIAVVTNLELEHLDCYSDLDDLKEAFTVFVQKVPFYGTVILCLDEPGVQQLIPSIDRPILTYGINPQSEIRATDIKIEKNRSSFNLIAKGDNLGKIELSVPGEHNIKNALAASAIALELDVPFDKIVEGFKDFTGVKRRFEIKGLAGDILVIDDYAHHFSEIKATLKAAKNGYSRRIIALFQPHLYSRTRDFYREFGASFHEAEILFIAPIYPAREAPIEGVSGKMIAEAAADSGHKAAYYCEDRSKLVDDVLAEVKPGDMIITMGAGDIWKEGVKILEKLETKAR